MVRRKHFQPPPPLMQQPQSSSSLKFFFFFFYKYTPVSYTQYSIHLFSNKPIQYKFCKYSIMMDELSYQIRKQQTILAAPMREIEMCGVY